MNEPMTQTPPAAPMAAPAMPEYNYQGVGKRFVAYFVDSIIAGGVYWGLLMAGGDMDISGNTISVSLTGIWALLWFAFIVLYWVGMEATSGATLGKMMMGMKVVDEDGGSIGWGKAIIRNLLRIVDGLFLYLVGAIFVWTSDKKQRLGDRAAGTYVISSR